MESIVDDTGEAPEVEAEVAPEVEADEVDADEVDADEDDEPISRQQARKLRQENASLRSRMKEQADRLSEIDRERMSEQERAIEDAKAQVRSEMATELASERLAAAAKGRLANPADAALFIEVDNADADFDQMVGALLEERPYLAASASEKRGIDQGPRGTPPKAAPKTFGDLMSEGTKSKGRITL